MQPVLWCFLAAGGTCPGLPFALSFSQVGSAHGGLKPRLTLLWSVKVWVSLSHPFIKCFLLKLGRAADEVAKKILLLHHLNRTGEQMP